MKKRTIALALSALIATTALVGCGSGDSGARRIFFKSRYGY